MRVARLAVLTAALLATTTLVQAQPMPQPRLVNSFSMPSQGGQVQIQDQSQVLGTGDLRQDLEAGKVKPQVPAAAVTTPAVEQQTNAQAPNFVLENAKGETIALASYLQKGPLLVMFANGATFAYTWPKLEILQKNMSNFRALGIQVVVITPDKTDTLQKLQEKAGFEFDMLSDNTYSVSTQYGMADMKTPTPVFFAISQDGKILGRTLAEPMDLNAVVAPLRAAAKAPQPMPQEIPGVMTRMDQQPAAPAQK